jgi:hypothetical protein
MRMSIAALLLSLSLGACATYEPVPKEYTGPTAYVADSGWYEDRTKARMFALIAIDGNWIKNAFSASASASHEQGASLTAIYPDRKVPARPMKVLLKGSHATGAPINAIVSQLAGTFFSVEGTVDFTPEAGKTYRVRGELAKEKSSVWIEDTSTGKAVTAVVTK